MEKPWEAQREWSGASAFHFDARIRPRCHCTHSHHSHVHHPSPSFTHPDSKYWMDKPHVYHKLSELFWIYLTLLEDPVSLSVATEGTTVTKDKSDKMATRRQGDTSRCESQHVTATAAVSHSAPTPNANRVTCHLKYPLSAEACRTEMDGGKHRTKRFSDQRFCEVHWNIWNNFWPVRVQCCF